MSHSFFALQWTELGWGIIVAIALAGLIWVPYLIKEIRDGKRDAGPLRRMVGGGRIAVGPASPAGAGDINPGRRGDPAPGQPDAQPDPYGDRAQRKAPPVQS